MRPTSNDLLPGRSRKSSYAEPLTSSIDMLNDLQQHQGQQRTPPASNSAAMTYFLADEATMAAATEVSLSPRFRSDSMASRGKHHQHQHSRDMSVSEDDDDERSSIASFPLSMVDTLPPSSPAKPSHLRNFFPADPSFASTPNLSSGSLASDMVNSGVQLDPSSSQRRQNMSDSQRERGDSMASSSFMPELIMPTLKMPARRPFTARGKDVGRLKILVAGDSGIGKSSLIKSILQMNEDIVHVDPLSVQNPSSSITSSYYDPTSQEEAQSTSHITEVFTSTRPYPHWWSEFEDSRVLRRRKSGGEFVLERNIVFVDTPGYGAGSNTSDSLEPTIRYVEQQLQRTASSVNNGDGDLLGLLTGHGSLQVDLVLYVILHRLKPVDIDYIRRLSAITNVLPVIAKADTLTPQQTITLKTSILNDLRNAGIRAFLFGKSADDIERSPGVSAPFAISTAYSQDVDNMDASLLMSSDYTPPFIKSELENLISDIFNVENASWLRHASMKKFLTWRDAHRTQALVRTDSRPSSGTRSLGPASGSVVLQGGAGSGSGSMNNSFTMAKLSDHTQREDRLAHIRLSKWAHDLQRSLTAERERYERLTRGERAVWLTERLGECVIDGSLVPVNINSETQLQMMKGLVAKGGLNGEFTNRRDPLGLVRMGDGFRRKVGMVWKVAGSLGVGAGLVLVLVRVCWGWTPEVVQRYYFGVF